MIKSTKEFWTNAYQKNIGKLIAICYRYTRNYQLSEDLAHDAFLKAIDKAASFRGEGEFDAWLRRIVVNHVLQHLRDQKKKPYLEDLMLEHAETETEEENTHLIMSIGVTTDELLEIVDQLPEHHRLVFNLYVLEKFTHAQIGGELGISEGTSKSHLARARKKLKQLLVSRVEHIEKKEEKKRVFLLPFVISDDAEMDQLFEKSFDSFLILPKHPLSMDMIKFPGQQGLGKISFIKSYRFILATSVIISILPISWFILRKNENTKETKVADQSVSFLPKPIDSGIDTSPKKSFELQTATILQDSIIPERNINPKSMKPLDSLALILILSSSVVNTPSMVDSIKNQIEKINARRVLPSIDSPTLKNQLAALVDPMAARQKPGTFRASKLYWAKDNQELFFLGKVSVNFKDQHFRGNGSFNFLGKVYLLVVEGQLVELGKTIELSDNEYNLEVLKSKEAISKYGEAGRNGVIEISRSN